jgi:uncharacterized membrane protein HdeD (DUF308 family)
MAQIKKVKTGRKADEAIFGKKNWMILGAGVVSIVIGFVTLSVGDTTFAPILLVLGYCVLIPIGIMIKDTPREVEDTSPKSVPR